MPQMDGFEVQSRLAQTRWLVPVVVITGWDIPGACERAMEAGATAFLRKPVDGKVLQEAIASSIARVP